MKFKKIFITVGTTEFNQLIQRVSEKEIHEILKDQLGCEKLSLQIGNGKKIEFSNLDGIDVDVFTLKSSITDDIEAADLVSS